MKPYELFGVLARFLGLLTLVSSVVMLFVFENPPAAASYVIVGLALLLRGGAIARLIYRPSEI